MKKRSSQPDSVIDEIRAIRHKISAAHGHDPARLVASLIEYQRQFEDRLLRPEPASRRTPRGQ